MTRACSWSINLEATAFRRAVISKFKTCWNKRKNSTVEKLLVSGVIHQKAEMHEMCESIANGTLNAARRLISVGT